MNAVYSLEMFRILKNQQLFHCIWKSGLHAYIKRNNYGNKCFSASFFLTMMKATKTEAIFGKVHAKENFAHEKGP